MTLIKASDESYIMLNTDGAFDFYSALISCGISNVLLDSVRVKGADLSILFQCLHKVKSVQTSPSLLVEYEWQLLILGCSCYDYHSLQPDFWKQKDNIGNTPILYLGWSGNREGLNWILANRPELLDEKNNRGSTIAHFAAMSGNQFALQWILTEKPALLELENNNGFTIAHSAALSGNLDGLKWIFANKPELLDRLMVDGFTLAHSAAMSGRVDVLGWVLALNPRLLNKKTSSGENLAHLAASVGDIAMLQWIQINYPHLLEGRTKKGLGIAHYAIESGNAETLAWIFANKPTLLNDETNAGGTIAHCAASWGNSDALSWIFTNKPKMLEKKNKLGRTIVHFAVLSSNNAIIDYLLQEHPSLAKRLWISDNKGNTPQNLAPVSLLSNPNQLITDSLLSATNRVIDGRPNLNDAALLLAFQEEWQCILMKVDGQDAQRMIDGCPHFPKALQSKIINIESRLRLKSFSFTGGLVTRTKFHALIGLTKKALSASHGFFFSPSDSHLIKHLSKFLSKVGEDVFNEKEIFCLKLVVDDYERGFYGEWAPEIKILIGKLRSSITLCQLRPTAVITAGLDICVEKFSDYLKTFRERVDQLPLDKDVARTMHDVILSGIEMVINEEDKIIHHVKYNFGELYYLNEKLPLHTDHIPTKDAEAYRLTLRRLLTNLFGAAEIAYSKGHMVGFCGKLSTGYCFEDRVWDTFAWVSCLSEIVSFDELMDRFVNKEYLAYKKVMSDIYDEQMIFIEGVCHFIMVRYRGLPCLPNPIYAPNGQVTQIGVKKYLETVLNFTEEESILDRFCRYMRS